MFEEIFNYAVLGGVLFLIAYGLKKFTKLRKVQVKTSGDANKKGLKLPDSIKESLDMVVSAMQVQIHDVEEACKKAGKNPMDETSYMTLVNQYQAASKWQERFSTHPAFMMFDQIGYPILKELVPDGVSMIKRVMRYA